MPSQRVSRLRLAKGWLTKYEFADLLEQQAASILQMDLTITGGILEAKKIASMGEAHYAQIAPHLYGGPIGGAANIQLDVCSPNFLIQEGIHTWGRLSMPIFSRSRCSGKTDTSFHQRNRDSVLN